jgi:hypothetical protein
LTNPLKATTLFPICFAAIAGRATVRYATWKLEKGTTLGYLEQLMGSRTVASTLTTQLQLRSFNWIGFGLIIIWALSPIGGQSILHILYTPIKPVSNLVPVSYFNLRQQSYGSPNGAFKGYWYPGFAALFASSLLSPQAVKEGSSDFWGNVKIPYYSSVLSAGAVEDSDGWAQISPGITPIYSSLFGIPLWGISIGNTTFTIESTYLELVCTNITLSGQTTPDGPFTKTSMISPDGPFISFNTVSDVAPWAIGYKGLDIITARPIGNSSYIYPQSCPDCLSQDYATLALDPGTLLYQEYSLDENVTSVFCTPSQAYIESSVLCSKSSTSQECRVTAQRLSQLPHMPPEITLLSFPRIAQGLTTLLPNSTSQFSVSDPIQNYLYDPKSESSIIAGASSLFLDTTERSLQSVSLKDFGDRLGQIVNTFLYGSLWNSTAWITGAPFDGFVAERIGGNNASFIPATSADLTAMIRNRTAAFTVPAILEIDSTIYHCDFSWLAVFLVSTLVMFLSAILGVVFSRRTNIPDYLGYVSSLARESPYIRMPDVGVIMDGMDKARMVKEVKVRLGDVSDPQSGSSVGRLAFARMEETTVVKRGRLYT